MQRIHYSGADLVTGDDLARAVTDYARALALSGRSATVRLPVRLKDGGVGEATLLIGPASQLVAEAEASPFDELTDPALVAKWRGLTEAIDKGSVPS